MLEKGVVAEFDSAQGLLHAVTVLRERGYQHMDTFTPFPVPGVGEKLGLPRSRLSVVMLLSALVGGALAYLIQWWTNAVDYPLLVGGRPNHAAPAFVLITFEASVLLGVLGGLAALIAACGLPRTWHPVFEVEGFERHSVDRYWLGIDASDPMLEREHTARELMELGALRVVPVGGA